MLDYIKGILTVASPEKVTVENSGLGYQFHVPLSTYSALPKLGKEVQLFVHTVIREDSHKSYGFLTADERTIFEKVINVSGIGPKTGVALVGHLDGAAFQSAVQNGNVSMISKVPGIGKKTAERLIIEMRDKASDLCKNISAKSVGGAAAGQGGGAVFDAISALINLGYPAAQAQKAVNNAASAHKELPELAKLITLALQEI